MLLVLRFDDDWLAESKVNNIVVRGRRAWLAGGVADANDSFNQVVLIYSFSHPSSLLSPALFVLMFLCTRTPPGTPGGSAWGYCVCASASQSGGSTLGHGLDSRGWSSLEQSR